jgi:putative DNA primase/helicase
MIDRVREIRDIRHGRDRQDSLAVLERDLIRKSSLCYIRGDMHYFNGRVYSLISPITVRDTLFNIMIDAGAPPMDVRKVGDLPLSVLAEKEYRRANFLAFSNGVLDLDTLYFHDGFSSETRVTEYVPYGYNPQAVCPAWEAFLAEVLPDPDMRNVLQEFFGMVYLDREHFSVEKFAIFVGKGANGKSVIFEVMKRALGPEQVTTLDSAQLTDEKMLPYVKGARLNFSPDMARQKDFTSSLKALASGQDVTGRKIYGDAEKIKCPPLCFAMNELPAFKDGTDAFFRRLLLFSFEVQIPPHRQDKRLAERICKTDLPGIFNWIIQGRFRLIRNSGEFSFCEKMDTDLTLIKGRVQSGTDYPVRAFLEGRGLSVYPSYEGQPTVLISRDEIFNGLGGRVSTHAITRELVNFGVQTYRSKEMRYKVYEKVR